MEVRLSDLSPHVEYTLDCAVEAYEIDACTHLALRLYGDNGRLIAIVGPPLEPRAPGWEGERSLPAMIAAGRSNLARRLAMCREFVREADDVMLALPPEEAGGLAYRAVAEVPHRVKDLAEILSSWAVVDETVGGDLKPHRDRHRLTRRGDPTPRLARRLASPRFIRWYVRESPDSDRLRDMAEHQLARAAMVGRRHLACRFREIEEKLRRQMAVAKDRALRKMVEVVPDARERKVLRRSAAVAESVVGSEQVSRFIGGDEVTIAGEAVSLVVHRRGSLAAIGHSAVAVAVNDADGEELAQLCVFFPGTPALDQLAALALHMQAGLEAEILRHGNVISMSDRARDHPLFWQRFVERADEMRRADAALLGMTPREVSSWERDRRLSREYFARTGATWVDKLSNHVLGRRRGELAALIEAGKAA